jgi:Tol biopolymer transport system component
VWLFHPRWSGDGRSIVFEQDTWASDLLSEESLESVAVATVAVDGSSPPTTIATWPGPLAGGDAPAPDWSPVDDLLVFSRDGNLFTASADGGDPVQVTDFDGVTEHAVQPTFTPDGDGIVFTYVTGRWDVDDSPSAALIRLDGSGFEVLAQGVPATHPRLRPD